MNAFNYTQRSPKLQRGRLLTRHLSPKRGENLYSSGGVELRPLNTAAGGDGESSKFANK